MDTNEPIKDVRNLSREEFRKAEQNMLRGLSVAAAEARAQKMLDEIAAAPDDTAKLKIIRRYGS